jgi:hypothetical protein
VSHIDNARDLDDLLSLQKKPQLCHLAEQDESGADRDRGGLDIYEVNPLHHLSYQTPTSGCDFIFSSTFPGIFLKRHNKLTFCDAAASDESVVAMKNLLQSAESSVTVKK